MRILVLTSTPRVPDNHLLWQGLGRFADVEVRLVEKEQQRRLRKVFAGIDLSGYDIVIVDLLFRYVSRHARLFKTISKLVFYEEDAGQEFMSDSKWYGKFSPFYQKLPHARVILTGHFSMRRFWAMDIDAHFAPKGYDSDNIYLMDKTRDIELGFIGRLASRSYRERKKFIEKAEKEFGLQLLRTEPGDDYRETLNRIRIFVSADIGFNEYMAKNFEAMACGCVLLARRQGEGEEEALGLVDGEHLLLYGNDAEFVEKLTLLRNAPALADKLSRQGSAFVKERFDYFKLSESVYQCLQAERAVELPKPRGLSGLFYRLFKRQPDTKNA